MIRIAVTTTKGINQFARLGKSVTSITNPHGDDKSDDKTSDHDMSY